MWIRKIVQEVFGLFVDDGSFAMAILAWLGVAGFVLPRMRIAAPVGILLFAGLVLILVESVARFSRRSAEQQRPRIRHK
jgi:membrane protein implicated in regulation of membrane protease activity